MLSLRVLILCKLLVLIWSGIYGMEKDQLGDERKEQKEKKTEIKMMYTYSRNQPVIVLNNTLENVDERNESNKWELGISLDMDDENDFGVSIEGNPLGTSIEHTTDEINSFIDLDPYSFDVSDDEAIPGPSYSTPVKPGCPVNFIFTLEKDEASSFNMTSSSIYSEISFSNVDTEENEISLVKPKPLNTVSTEGRTTTFLLEKFVTSLSINKAMGSKCCARKCCSLFSYTEYKNYRSAFWSKSHYQQDNYILEKFRSADKDRGHFYFFESSKRICSASLKLLYKIDKNRFIRLKKRYLQGCFETPPPQERLKSDKYLGAMNWLELYAFYHADRMPDSEKWMLPYKTRKIIIYRQYKEEATLYLSKSAFYGMWINDFPNLQIKKVNCFSKCTKCTSIERQLEITTHPKKRNRLLQARNEHNHRQMMERQYYYKKREASKRSPTKYLSLIIDGMDQSKSNLPHFVGRIAKAINPGDQLKTHISGIIAHGQHKFFTFLDIGQFPHDSNLTMNLILMALKKLADMAQGKLPPVLYLQADNCWRENKNKYMLAFCELMVAERIFNEVQLSFLMVGHTHEDIDAGFSKIADKLRRNDAETLPELVNLLPSKSVIDYLYDIRSWITPSIVDIRKHTRPLHYKFTRKSGLTETYYKGRASDKWRKINGGLLNRDGNGNIKRIRGLPKLCPILFDKIGLDKIKSHLHHWKCLFRNQMDLSSFHWWRNFLLKWDDLKKSPKKCKDEIFNKAVWLLPKLPKQAFEDSDQLSDGEESAVPDSIQVLLDEELENPQVEIVRKTRPQQGKRPKTSSKKSAESTSSNRRGKRTKKLLTKNRNVVMYSDIDRKRKEIIIKILRLILSILSFHFIYSLILPVMIWYLLYSLSFLYGVLFVHMFCITVQILIKNIWRAFLKAHIQYNCMKNIQMI